MCLKVMGAGDGIGKGFEKISDKMGSVGISPSDRISKSVKLISMVICKGEGFEMKSVMIMNHFLGTRVRTYHH